MLSKWHVGFLKNESILKKNSAAKFIVLLVQFQPFLFYPFAPTLYIYILLSSWHICNFDLINCVAFEEYESLVSTSTNLEVCTQKSWKHLSFQVERSTNKNCFITLKFSQQNARGSSLVSHSMSQPFLGVRF